MYKFKAYSLFSSAGQAHYLVIHRKNEITSKSAHIKNINSHFSSFGDVAKSILVKVHRKSCVLSGVHNWLKPITIGRFWCLEATFWQKSCLCHFKTRNTLWRAKWYIPPKRKKINFCSLLWHQLRWHTRRSARQYKTHPKASRCRSELALVLLELPRSQLEQALCDIRLVSGETTFTYRHNAKTVA